MASKNFETKERCNLLVKQFFALEPRNMLILKIFGVLSYNYNGDFKRYCELDNPAHLKSLGQVVLVLQLKICADGTLPLKACFLMANLFYQNSAISFGGLGIGEYHSTESHESVTENLLGKKKILNLQLFTLHHRINNLLIIFKLIDSVIFKILYTNLLQL